LLLMKICWNKNVKNCCLKDYFIMKKQPNLTTHSDE